MLMPSRRKPSVGACWARRTLMLALAIATTAATPAQTGVALPAAPSRAAYVPTVASDVLQQVPAASDPTVRLMADLRAKLNADPTNVVVADQLARAYIDFGRQLGDAHYAGYAEAVIAPWMAKAPPPPVALVLQATILQFRHQFSEARDLLKKAIQRDPQNTQAWLTLATLDMVQGDYATAAKDCSQVSRRGGIALGLACTGNLRSYTGQAQQSAALLAQLGADAPTLSVPFKAWIEGLLAETYERLGDWSAAEAHYRKALSYAPDDNFTQVAYADFLLDRGRPQEVLTLLARSAQSDTAFLRLALAHAALGSPDTARYTWIMAARFAALTQRGSDYYGREQVRFALHLQHDPATALDLAERNWQVQRAPWDVRVLLEAALAAGRPSAALPVLAFLDQTKLQDPMIEPLARQLRAQLKPQSTPLQ
jgi:Tfp pilus assembly protein PilF